ncbi:MAG TPA: hypothetical protein VEA80_04945 [Vitreimonas sp.]|uniref:hypothetical protein n=1 Tax=Vitreimonas sp. TaxID=3069702 RepID=UPI002D4FD3E6|nr:hypothetical protein [Vitreimonas sp.]HYD86799.1 hypothetical protein [Vitreimonas sp.]
MKAVPMILAAFALAACATAEGPQGTPSLDIAPGQPAPPQAQFYIDCIDQASEARTYDREEHVIRFHCGGAPAQRFFDGLRGWSADEASEIGSGGVLWRFTSPMRQNPSFLDFCRRTGEGHAARYDCTVVLNVGEFLAQ